MIRQASVSVNSFIEQLQNQIDELDSKQLDYLVIAHADSCMIDQLKNALANSSLAVVALPQNCWVMGDENIAHLADWAINELAVKSILLVGHSRGGTPVHNVQVCTAASSSEENGSSQNRVSSILDRIQKTQALVRQNEEHFIHELESLRETPSISGRLMRDPDLVQGLFYRAESGVFCAYQPQTRSFVALIDQMVVA